MPTMFRNQNPTDLYERQDQRENGLRQTCNYLVPARLVFILYRPDTPPLHQGRYDLHSLTSRLVQH